MSNDVYIVATENIYGDIVPLAEQCEGNAGVAAWVDPYDARRECDELNEGTDGGYFVCRVTRIST